MIAASFTLLGMAMAIVLGLVVVALFSSEEDDGDGTTLGQLLEKLFGKREDNE